jgi:hypothetical protein
MAEIISSGAGEIVYVEPPSARVPPRKSCGQGQTKVTWTMKQVEEVAVQLHSELPPGVKILLDAPFKGDLLKLCGENTLTSPCKDDVSTNSIWLRPFQRHNPYSVPSGYFIADVLLFLDYLFAFNLLAGDDCQGKTDKAMDEARKIKKLIGHLRHLFRKANSSRNEDVHNLKRLMKKRKGSPSADSSTSSPAEGGSQVCDLLMEFIVHLSVGEMEAILDVLGDDAADDILVAESVIELFGDGMNDSVAKTLDLSPVVDGTTKENEEEDRKLEIELFGDLDEAPGFYHKIKHHRTQKQQTQQRLKWDACLQIQDSGCPFHARWVTDDMSNKLP